MRNAHFIPEPVFHRPCLRRTCIHLEGQSEDTGLRSLPWRGRPAAALSGALGPRRLFGRQGLQGADVTVPVWTALVFASQEDYSKSPIFSCVSASGKGKVIFKENQHYQFNLLAQCVRKPPRSLPGEGRARPRIAVRRGRANDGREAAERTLRLLILPRDPGKR